MVTDSRVIMKIRGPKREGVLENGDNYIMRSFLICTHQIKKDEMNEACLTYGRKEKY